MDWVASALVGGPSHLVVGRERELGLAREAIAAGLSGSPRVVLVTGEAGAGKSTVLGTVAASLPSEVMVLDGYALRGDGVPPFFPLNIALGGLPAPQPRGLGERLGVVAPVLAAAGIGPRVDGGARAMPLDPEAQRFRLLEALAETLALAAEDRPVALLLDDMQWASPACWDALVYAIRAVRHGGARFALLIAARDEFLQVPGAGSAAVNELNRLRMLTHVALGPLPRGAVAELIRARLGEDAPEGLLEAVASRSGGNPFFVEELIAGLDPAVPPDARAGQPNLPITVQLAITERLALLPQRAVDLLGAAALVGPSFEASMVEAISGVPREEVAADLDLACGASLLVPGSAGEWGFRHDLIREALISQGGARSRGLHAAIAAALEDRGEQRELDGAIRIAYHRRAAGEPFPSCEASLRAARLAAAQHDPDRSLTEARAAAAEARRLGVAPADHALRFEAFLVYGDTAMRSGQYAEAEAALQDASRAAEFVADSARVARVSLRLGMVYRRWERPDAAAACLESAVSNAGDLPSAELMTALIELATLDGLTRGRYAEAEAAAHRALDLARAAASPAFEAQAILALANTLTRSQDPAQQRAMLASAFERAVAGEDLALAAEVSASISNSFYWTGELNEARRWALTRVDVATRGHDLFGMRHGHSWLAFVASSQGDWAEARELLDQAEAVLSRQNSPEPIGFLRVVRAFIHLRTGAAEAAYRDAREAIDLLLPLGDATVVWYASLLVLICLEAGRVSEARAEISHQERRLAAMPASSLPARSARAALAFAYVALGQADAAAACEEALAPYEGDYHWSPVRCSLAALARFRGDNGHALALLLRAAEQARAERQLPDLVAILVAHVELLPDSRERREMTLEAEQLAQELGMPPPFAGGRRAPSTAAVPPPYSLTPRELEVLRLVAEGRTNRDIAAALVITERTVINHLGSVFAKIGVENRSAATAFAIRNGLTELGH